MKRRIEQLLNGIFEYEAGQVVIRPESLELSGEPGDVLHGKFFVEGADGQRVHGFLYPSDVRMICDPVEFHGISNEIHYQYDCSGLKAMPVPRSAGMDNGERSVCTGRLDEPERASDAAKGRPDEPEGTAGPAEGRSDMPEGISGAAEDEPDEADERFSGDGESDETRGSVSGEDESDDARENIAFGENKSAAPETVLAAADGKITVCCDCGEFVIPYSVCIGGGKAAEALPFSNLAEFADLAQTNYQKAYRYFLMPEFRETLKSRPELLALCEGLSYPDISYRTLEEFLTGAGLKERLMISVESQALDFGELKEPVQETLRLQKNTWGFQTISVESDALFVRPEKKLITTDEFAGSTFDLHLILDTNLMHAGNNYARLKLEAGRQTILVEVTAKRQSNQLKNQQSHIQKIMRKKLENLYVSFRLQKSDLATWIEHSTSVINSYKRAGGDDPFADLFLVQMYFADEKKYKATRLLEQIEAQKEKLNTPERYCYYLYISTFIYSEASYVDRVEEEVSHQFYRNPASWPLLWILLYLQEKYLNDPAARYEAVAAQFTSGCRSRILYLEAWQALRENPFLMRHLGEFELHLLRFADQEKVMTAEILRQSANLAMHLPKFDRRLFEVLANGWRLYPSDDLVKAICQILIRGEKKEREYFEWYERGVESGLRMNGLYEAYMQTMDLPENALTSGEGGKQFKDLPQIIRMYFAYDTSLDYHRRAALYRSIVENKDTDPQTWLNYRAPMERFVMEQLESVHITDDLVVLYQTFLRENMITAQLAKKLIQLLFTYEITCDMPGICQIVVHSERIPQEVSVNLHNGRGKICIYDPDGAVFAVDTNGQRFVAGAFCAVRHLFENEKMLAWCAKKTPESPGLVAFLCVESQKASLMNESLLPFFCTGCELEQISPVFRDELREQVLTYYLAHPREDSLPEFLERISCEEYALVDKAAMVSLLAEEGRCMEAFDLLNAYGAEDIPLMQLVRICSRMVLELEFEENPMLLSLCYRCFAMGKYDDKLLRYLLLYYEGAVEDMRQVWSAASEFGLDTMLLEEKIMTMMLFTRQGTQGSEPIFEAYVKKMGRKRLCKAYVNLKSYEYFVKGLPIADSVFAFIEKEYRRLSGTGALEEQEEVCRLALLDHYARSAALTKAQRVYASEILEEFNTKGMRFAFFGRFDRELRKPLQLQGHVFAEYVGNPKSTVYILYRRRENTEVSADVPALESVGSDIGVENGIGISAETGTDAGKLTAVTAEAEDGFIEELVPNCFEGIFVKEFVLFAGEEMECGFLEIPPLKDGEKEKSEIHTEMWILKAESEEKEAGMYGLLNRLCGAVHDGDEMVTQEILDAWLTYEYLSEEVFTLV